KIIDYQRRRINQVHSDVADIDIVGQQLNHEQQVQIHELLLAMDRLPPEQRETFILQQEGFSNREISDITGVGSETVKSRLRYAKSSLRTRLGGEA
ncbi:MAG: sigma-70 family RNA polymerase sigma factor, partial [Pseudomonadota bacterium]